MTIKTEQIAIDEQAITYCVYRLIVSKSSPKFWARVTGVLATRQEAEKYIKKRFNRSHYALFAYDGKAPIPFKIFENDSELKQLTQVK